jgi:hypothetical protein
LAMASSTASMVARKTGSMCSSDRTSVVSTFVAEMRGSRFAVENASTSQTAGARR